MAAPLTRLLARLEALLPVFSRPATDTALVDQVAEVIQEVHEAAPSVQLSGVGPDERRAAERVLGAVGDTLLALDAALASQDNSAFPRLPPVIVQLTTASELFSACARLAGCLQLGAPTLYRLTSALVLVTGPSRLALVAALKPARTQGPIQASALALLASLAGSQMEALGDLLRAVAGLPDSAAALQQMEHRSFPPPAAFVRWLSAVTDALLTVGDGTRAGSRGPDIPASRHVELVRWIDICRLVVLCDRGSDPSAPPTPLQAAVCSDAALRTKASQLLAGQVLPAMARHTGLLPLPGGRQLPPGRPSTDDWQMLGTTVALLVHNNWLDEALDQYYADHDRETMQLALDLVAGMPTTCPPGHHLPAHWFTWMYLAGLLARAREGMSMCECCRRGRGRPPTKEELEAVAWRLLELAPKMAAVIREVAAAPQPSDDDDSAAEGSSSGQAAGGSGGEAASASDGSSQQQEQQQGGASPGRFNFAAVQGLCLSWARSLQLVSAAGEVRSAQHVAAYCAASDAGLRLLPLLMQRHEDMQRRLASGMGLAGSASHSRHGTHSGHGTHSSGAFDSAALRGDAIASEDAFAGLAELLMLRLFHEFGPKVQHYLRVQIEGRERLPPALLALVPAMLQLAATQPRLLQWAAGPAQAVPGLPDPLIKWEWLVLPASGVVQMSYELVRQQGKAHMEQGDDEASHQLYSSLVLTLAAFSQALLLVAPHLAPEQVQGSAARKALLVPFVSSAAMVMAHHSPTRLTSQLCPVLHSGLQQLAAAPPESAALLAYSIVRWGSSSAQLAAELIRLDSVPLLFGLLAAGLHGVPAQLGMVQLSNFVECLLSMIGQLLSAAQVLLSRFDSREAEGGSSSSGSAAGGSGAAGGGSGVISAAAAEQLRHAEAAVPGVILALRSAFSMMQQQQIQDRPDGPRLMAMTLQQLWTEEEEVPQRLEALAAALQAAWAEPASLEREQLEVAEVAAAGRCAYLRCANLGGEGGLAAGQGEGSKRCSACRSVWYCGTACSHADWRQGGHKRTCKALAALRQQAKQQREKEGDA